MSEIFEIGMEAIGRQPRLEGLIDAFIDRRFIRVLFEYRIDNSPESDWIVARFKDWEGVAD